MLYVFRIQKTCLRPENVLLGAVILGIGALAEKFKSRRKNGIQKRTVDDKRVKLLEGIIDFSHFLKKDRFISKLIMHYYKNFNGIDLLLQKVQRRMSYGKIGRDYLKLIQFLQILEKLG